MDIKHSAYLDDGIQESLVSNLNDGHVAFGESDRLVGRFDRSYGVAQDIAVDNATMTLGRDGVLRVVAMNALPDLQDAIADAFANRAELLATIQGQQARLNSLREQASEAVYWARYGTLGHGAVDVTSGPPTLDHPVLS